MLVETNLTEFEYYISLLVLSLVNLNEFSRL